MLAHHNAHGLWQTPAKPIMRVLQRAVNLQHHVLEVLALEIAQNLHRRALDLLDIANCRSAAVIDGHNAVHQVVVLLVVSASHVLDHFVDLGDAVVDDLDPVVQVCELVGLTADAAGQDVLEHLGHVRVVGTALLVGLLRVALLRGHVGLFLVPGGLCVVLVGVFGLFCVDRRDDELMDFEGVRVFGGGGADTEVVAVWEVNLWVVST
jgi:hypothetical protein